MRYKISAATQILLMIIITAIVVTGCKDKEEQKSIDSMPENSPENSKDVEDDLEQEDNDENIDTLQEDVDIDLSIFAEIDDIPQSTEDLINQQEGQFSRIDVRDNSVKEEVIREIRKLEPLPDNATEEQMDAYFKYLYAMIAEDFPDPLDTIKKWEFGSFGNPDIEDSRFHFKENYNVEILLDASGSMGAYIGDKTMMQIAKETISGFMKQVPEEANVSFRVYGHKGTGDNSDKELSCSSIEQLYGYAPYDEEAFSQVLNQVQPAGWTPLADALTEAEIALKDYDTEDNTNLIYVVSDGVETCDGNPVDVAKSLSNSHAKPIINIIGFNVDNEAQTQLKEMAEVSGGIFSTANDQYELEEEFLRAEEVLNAWEDWKKDNLRDVENFRVQNSFDITKTTNDWGQKDTLMTNNIARLIRIFEDEEIINREQYNYFRSKRSEVMDVVSIAKKEVRQLLNDVNAEKINELKQSIRDRYDEGTND